MKNKIVKTSKFLSYVLRHRPDEIGITLSESGWVDVEVLLSALNAHGKDVDRPLLDEVVASNDKQRFAFSEDGTQIRANQGHSLDVSLELEAKEPPEFLFHGTATRFLELIRVGGLIKRNRHHVHLSAQQETAVSVGSRHGKVHVLTVASKAMHDDGHVFYLSKNGVWLTDHVPVEYIKE